MRLSIGFIDMPTLGTSAAGVSGVHPDYRYTFAPRFVFDKRSQLPKRPTVQSGTLTATSRNSRADAAQIFKRDRAASALRLCHNLFADAMVGVFGKTSLFARKFFQFALCRARAFGLQFGTQAAMAMAHVVDVTCRVDFAIRIHRDIRHTQIHAKRELDFLQFRFFYFARCLKKELVAEQDQVCFAQARLEQRALSFAADQRDAKPTFYRPDRNRRVIHAPRQDAVIVSNAASRFEFAARLLVQLVGIGNFGDDADCHLCGEVELGVNIFVTQVMQIILLEGLGLPGLLAHELAGDICRFQCALERISLFRRWQ